MASLLDKIAKQKTVLAPPVAAPISLRGTGLTKRMAEADTKTYEKQVAKSIEGGQGLFKSEAEERFDAALHETIAALQSEQIKGSIILDESQVKAIAGILHNQFAILIGAAGTGKTTLEAMILSELSKRVPVIDMRTTLYGQKRDDAMKNGTANNIPSIAGAAFTGRATQQMKRALPEKWHNAISTIHMMLGYAPTEEMFDEYDAISGQTFPKAKRVFRPTFGEALKLPYTVFVFDESSMIPIPLWNEFIAATYPNVRILLIGDIHQLPPTHGKSVLGYAMRVWPVYELTHIHRQAQDNGIIKNAHNVLEGRMVENCENFHIIGNVGKSQAPPGAAAMKPYILQVVKQLHGMNRYDPYRDAIIVPQNKGMIGIDELNPMLVTMFNPEKTIDGIIVNKRTHIHTGTTAVYFAVGDKVMITSNINTITPPITNGMIGFVESININGKYDRKRSQVQFDNSDDMDDEEPFEFDTDALAMKFAMQGDEKEEDKPKDAEDQRQASHVMTIKFESGQTYSASTAGDYRRIIHGYASTCHKAQGGEYPNVIIVCHSANAVMLSREWLYTAITRARGNVYLICNSRGLAQALKRQMIKGATLADKIQAYVIETKSDDPVDVTDRMRFPILWPAKQVEWNNAKG